MEAFLAEAAADAVGGVEREGALLFEGVAHGITERAGIHLFEQAAGEADPRMGLHHEVLAEGLQEAAGGIEGLEAFRFAFFAVLRGVFAAGGHRLQPGVDLFLFADHLEAALERIERHVRAMAGVVLAEIALVAVVRRGAEQLARLRALRDHEEGTLRGFDFDFDHVEELVEVAGHHVGDRVAFAEEGMAVGHGDGEQGVGALFGFEVADDDRETVFLVEDQAGDLEEFVGHLALLHRAAEQFELGVVGEESAGDDGTEGRGVIVTGRTTVVAAGATIIASGTTRTITTRSAGAGARAVAARAAALSVTGRAAAITARTVAETRAIAIATRAAVAGADLFGGSADPGGPETKGREVQFEGLFLGRVVFCRVGGH